MISRDTIDKIYQAAIIEDVVGEFVHFKKSGSAYKGLSPFAPLEPLTNKSMKIKKSAASTQHLNVYPDPAVDVVNLRLSIPEFTFGNCSISIFDLSGKLYTELQVQRHDQMFTLNTTDWSAGSYQVVVNNNNKTLSHHTLLLIK